MFCVESVTATIGFKLNSAYLRNWFTNNKTNSHLRTGNTVLSFVRLAAQPFVSFGVGIAFLHLNNQILHKLWNFISKARNMKYFYWFAFSFRGASNELCFTVLFTHFHFVADVFNFRNSKWNSIKLLHAARTSENKSIQICFWEVVAVKRYWNFLNTNTDFSSFLNVTKLIIFKC